MFGSRVVRRSSLCISARSNPVEVISTPMVISESVGPGTGRTIQHFDFSRSFSSLIHSQR